MQVKDVMNTDVKTIGHTATVQDAAKRMTEFNIGSLIVTDGEKLVGIVTERDIIGKVNAAGKSSSGVKVQEIMTREVIMVGPDTELMEAVDIMTAKNTKKLPVVSRNKLVGIITVTDLCASQPKIIERFAHMLVGGKGPRKMVAG